MNQNVWSLNWNVSMMYPAWRGYDGICWRNLSCESFSCEASSLIRSKASWCDVFSRRFKAYLPTISSLKPLGPETGLWDVGKNLIISMRSGCQSSHELHRLIILPEYKKEHVLLVVWKKKKTKLLQALMQFFPLFMKILDGNLIDNALL